MGYLRLAFAVLVLPFVFVAADEKKPDTRPAPQVAGVFDLAGAPSVVFLCDSSGSMLTYLDPIRGQFRKAVDALRPGQTFNVILYQADGVAALDTRMLTPNDDNRKRASDFLDKTFPQSSTDPMPGLEAAFKLQPSAIFVMTNGDFPNNEAVRAKIAKLNVDRKVKVNTIALVEREESYEKFLKQLAAENGGSYRFASAAALAGEADQGEAGAAPAEPQVAGMFDLAGAPSIVFLCDSSGSMMTKFDALRQQLRKATEALRPGQSFDVVFMSEGGFVALNKTLLPCNDDNRRKCFDFLDKTAPHGSTDPLPGLRLALGLRPKLIYLLTDGDFPNNVEVQETIRKANKDKRTRVNTIAFIDRDEAYERFLKQVADENGGTYRYVDEKGAEAK